jgi:hypothetical protein
MRHKIYIKEQQQQKKMRINTEIDGYIYTWEEVISIKSQTQLFISEGEKARNNGGHV